LIEGTAANPSCSTSLVDVPKSRLVSWMTTAQSSGAGASAAETRTLYRSL
jgi:hypothetical protein